MGNHKGLHMVSFLLVIVGALNWGLIGLFNGFNLVAMIFGSLMWLERLVYVLVGLAGVWLLVKHKQSCKVCGADGGMKHGSPSVPGTPGA